MKVKEILEITIEDFEKMMTNEEFDRMQNLKMNYAWELLDLMQEGARLSGQEKDEEYLSISEYLDYLEEMEQ